uniref:Uncharacterized protein n=1 Tax=Anguilla anguilla TaxID=7936 RepID=A0A0E9RZX6_ANGAN
MHLNLINFDPFSPYNRTCRGQQMWFVKL